MAFLEKIGAMAKSASEKAGDAIEINRINGEIHTEKYRIEMLKQEIGDYYWAKFATGEQLDSEVMELCDKIVICHDRIRSYHAEIQTIKEEKEDEPEDGEEEESPVVRESVKCCKECGVPLAEGTKFCGECGKPV